MWHRQRRRPKNWLRGNLKYWCRSNMLIQIFPCVEYLFTSWKQKHFLKSGCACFMAYWCFDLSMTQQTRKPIKLEAIVIMVLDFFLKHFIIIIARLMIRIKKKQDFSIYRTCAINDRSLLVTSLEYGILYRILSSIHEIIFCIYEIQLCSYEFLVYEVQCCNLWN